MTDAVRSLNLATAVGIVLYEALRQVTGADPRLVWPRPRDVLAPEPARP
jgi:tRNA C32,U32 (ribose-2'-O)-methylase TrmJ